MTTEFVSVPSNWTVSKVLAHVRQVESIRETIYWIFVVDPESRKLVSARPLRRLIAAEPNANILAAALDRRLIPIPPQASREDATLLILNTTFLLCLSSMLAGSSSVSWPQRMEQTLV
jgi:magnesium transporter